ncbi:MAG TPA: 50S ribosomal protein L5, partial [Streptosporangiaceae bacterium]|nr:50S ribosomal protein L5 [Streptosporangiaceae bacterium]
MPAEKKSAKGSAGKGGAKGSTRTPNPQATIGKGRVEVNVDLGPSGGTALATEAPPARLKLRYQSEIAPALREEFGLANVMQIPTLTKIVVNMGVGEAARDAKLIEGA